MIPIITIKITDLETDYVQTPILRFTGYQEAIAYLRDQEVQDKSIEIDIQRELEKQNGL